MKKFIALGIDPGLANTGVALVEGSERYKLLYADRIRTDKERLYGDRLHHIYTALDSFLLAKKELIDVITVERCFHAKNISSSAGTFAVIGLVHLLADIHNLSILDLTPQQLKSVCGFGARAKKDEMLRAAKAMFRRQFDNHHSADAAFGAVAGILHCRTEAVKRRVQEVAG